MQFLLFAIRLLLALCPGQVEMLEAMRVPSRAPSARQPRASRTKVIVLPWLGWLEIDTNNPSLFSSERDRTGFTKRAGPLQGEALLRRKV